MGSAESLLSGCDCSAENDARKNAPSKDGVRAATAPTVPLGMQKSGGISATPTLVGSKAPNGILRQSPRRSYAYSLASSPAKTIVGSPTTQTPPASLPSHYRNSPEILRQDRSPSVPVFMHQTSSPTMTTTHHHQFSTMQPHPQQMFVQTPPLYASMTSTPMSGPPSYASQPQQQATLYSSAPSASHPIHLSPQHLSPPYTSVPSSSSLAPLAGSSWFPTTAPMYSMSPQPNSYVLQPSSGGFSPQVQLQQQPLPGIPYHQAGLRL